MKQMKVGDGKFPKLTARLTDSATHWRWFDKDWTKKDEQFTLMVRVDKKI